MDILESNRSYECYCGKGAAFEFAAMYILEHTDVSDISRLKVAVVSDRIVSGYYYNKFENQFLIRGVKPILVPVECNDMGKSLNAVDSVLRFISDFDFGPCDWIISLGGGGILDVTAFVHSLLQTKVNFMAVPTTLMSMTEGCVSSKAYLNFMSRKDIMSTAFEPDIVIVDPSFLSTVPAKYKSNGYASIIRYAILEDLSLIKIPDDMDSGLRDYLNRVYSCRCRIEKRDPRLLTLGSEISAAIEGYFRFMNYSEGEALALSLISAVDDSRREPLSKIYGVLGLPTALKDVSSAMILKNLKRNLDRYASGKVELVDMENGPTQRWVIRTLSADQAYDLLSERLKIIS
ncbi:MAG: iron-containing alcohol dehydrogenase [Clostridiales bacterium]|nr:iron-containing alcohol dehydrogenase [Clostridiales bacterium]